MHQHRIQRWCQYLLLRVHGTLKPLYFGLQAETVERRHTIHYLPGFHTSMALFELISKLLGSLDIIRFNLKLTDVFA